MSEAKLTATEGSLKGKEFVIDGKVVIGRLPENDIPLDDSTASRHHTQIEEKDEKFVVTDLDSQNGTFVNHSKVKEAILKNEDIITIGDSEFRFEQESEEQDDATVMYGTDADEDVTAQEEADATVIFRKAEAEEQDATSVEEPEDKTIIFKKEHVKEEVKEEDKTIVEQSDATVVDKAEAEEKPPFDPEKFFREKILERPRVLAAVVILFVLLVAYLFIPSGSTTGNRAKKSKTMADTPGLTAEDVLQQVQDPEVLTQQAQESLGLANSYYKRRRVKEDNLVKAIAKFEEARSFIEGLDPKPDIYEEVVAGLEEAKKTFEEEIQDGMFRIQQAMRMRDWEGAALEAKTVMAKIADNKDPQYKTAERKYREALSRMRK